MAITRQITTCLAPWTASQLANTFRDAFIGAGLMSAWFDSFTGSGLEHRILEVTYDASKAYGKTYYWFIFDSASVSVASCTGWDTSNKIPRGIGSTFGSPYLDWAGGSNASDAVTTKSRHYLLASPSNTTNCSLTRYSAGGRSFFTFRSGTVWNTFSIDHAAVSLRTWYNTLLASAYHNGFFTVSSVLSSVAFINRLCTRRAAFGGAGYGVTAGMLNMPMTSFSFQDLYLNAVQTGFFVDSTIGMPFLTNAANPALANDFLPVYNGIRQGAIYNSDLPSDFGITAIRGLSANTLAIQDGLVVNAGTEEYEVLSCLSRGSSGEANSLFLARTVG